MRYGKRINRLALVSVAVAALVVLGGVYASKWISAPVDDQAAITFEVKRGESVSQIASRLHKAGWLRHPMVWSLWARWHGLSGKLRAGEYQLIPDLSPQLMLQLFVSGKVILRQITVIEGTTYQNLRVMLSQRDDIQHTLADVTDAELMVYVTVIALDVVVPESIKAFAPKDPVNDQR